MIRPEGIWQSVDSRVTRLGKLVDDKAPKQLHIVYPPLKLGPQMLLGFTGLAEMPDGRPTIQWLRETLHGETRSITQTFEFLTERLTGYLCKPRFINSVLILCGGIFEGNKRFYFEMNNVHPSTRKVTQVFRYSIVEVNAPTIFAAGSGSAHIGPADRSLLQQQAQLVPSKWEDHSGLLAGVNRRTADKDFLVSPWCQVTFVVEGKDGASGGYFAQPMEPQGGDVLLNSVVFGIDTHDMLTEIMGRIDNSSDERPAPTQVAEKK